MNIIDHIKDIYRRLELIERTGADNTFVPPEVPTGLINGSNTVYTTSKPFVTASTMVYLDGSLQLLGTDYTETDTDEITMTTAPTGGSVMLIAYKSQS